MKFSLITFVIILLVSGCSQNDNSKLILSYPEKSQFGNSSTSKITKPIILDSAISLQKVKNFAESYNPPNSRIGTLPTLSDTIKAAFEIVKVKNYAEYEKYLSLIFVKLYRSNLRSSHQSFDFRKNNDSLDKLADPLIYKFNEMTGFYPKGKRVEFYSSALAQDWIELKPELLKNKDIKREMKSIKSVNDSIQKELYWK